MSALPTPRAAAERGFTLIEMIVVVFLLALAMLGILAVFDASARINKSEQDVADAQGAVRYGIYQMTRAIRIAGAGGLYLTQAVLNSPDPNVAGITLPAGTFDNVPSGTIVTSLNGDVPVRTGTDMIEVRGVINSPLVGFDPSSGCSDQCVGNASALTAKIITSNPTLGQHVNQDAISRPQFAAIDAYTAGATAAAPMYVLVSANDDVHTGCSAVYTAQSTYNVGAITAPTNLMGGGHTFGNVDFTDGVAIEYNNENPADPGLAARPIGLVARAGILDDLLYFIDNTDPNHPALAQGTRRGGAFDVVTLADDVEDMQIAYGVDREPNGAINRVTAVTATDTDVNVSNQKDGDEWAPNVPGEAPWTTIQFQADPAPGTFPHPGSPPAVHCPRLHGVMLTLVAKSRDPDPTYNAPVALGYRAMNSPVTVAPYPDTAKYPGLPGQPHFRRRIQTLKINLRNYAIQNPGTVP